MFSTFQGENTCSFLYWYIFTNCTVYYIVQTTTVFPCRVGIDCKGLIFLDESSSTNKWWNFQCFCQCARVLPNVWTDYYIIPGGFNLLIVWRLLKLSKIFCFFFKKNVRYSIVQKSWDTSKFYKSQFRGVRLSFNLYIVYLDTLLLATKNIICFHFFSWIYEKWNDESPITFLVKMINNRCSTTVSLCSSL